MSNWPNLTESWCPWCQQTILNPERTRLHDDAAEFRCPDCGRTHVRKEGIDDAVFFFFPADLADATAQEIPSLFGDY